VQVPEPETFHDDYATRSPAAKEATMRIDRDLTPTDLKEKPPAGLAGLALKKWQYQRYMRDYLACVESVDDNVGRLLDYLKKSGLAEDTIVVYTSDQGFFLGDHNWYDKRFMYEESLRMPFLARYPGVIKPGSKNADMVLNLDFPETFLDFAGQQAPADMQGRSFRPILEGHTPRDWRQSMYYRYWMHLADHGVPAHYGVRTRQYKLIYYYGKALGSSGAIDRDTAPEWELFDIQKDPHEMNNLYGDPKHEKTIGELKKELTRLRELYKDNDGV
jgi:arylsulfatase A-like enzyme